MTSASASRSKASDLTSLALGCSHPGCDKMGSVRWYIPRGLARPEIGPLLCVAHSALDQYRPGAQSAPARPPEAPTPQARQGSFL